MNILNKINICYCQVILDYYYYYINNHLYNYTTSSKYTTTHLLLYKTNLIVDISNLINNNTFFSLSLSISIPTYLPPSTSPSLPSSIFTDITLNFSLSLSLSLSQKKQLTDIGGEVYYRYRLIWLSIISYIDTFFILSLHCNIHLIFFKTYFNKLLIYVFINKINYKYLFPLATNINKY